MADTTVPCPHCGGEIAATASSCRHCGSSDQDGWRDDDIGVDDDFDYDDFVDENFSGSRRARLPARIWQWTAAGLLLLLLSYLLTAIW